MISRDFHIVLDFRGPPDLEALPRRINELMSDIGRKVTPPFQRLLYGPLAPIRRRPRRIQRKLEARNGRARYQAAFWRHCSRHNHEASAAGM